MDESPLGKATKKAAPQHHWVQCTNLTLIFLKQTPLYFILDTLELN